MQKGHRYEKYIEKLINDINRQNFNAVQKKLTKLRKLEKKKIFILADYGNSLINAVISKYESCGTFNIGIFRLIIDSGINITPNLNREPEKILSVLQLSGRLDCCCAGTRRPIGYTIYMTEWTPLIYFIHSNHLLYAELALKMGADPDAPDIGGYTPLYSAIKLNSLQAVSLLIRYKAKLKCCSFNSEIKGKPIQSLFNYNAPLMAAATVDNVSGELIKTLFNAQLNPNEPEAGSFPLHEAVINGNINAVNALLEHPDINTELTDGNAKTPFILSVESENDLIAPDISASIKNLLVKSGCYVPPGYRAHSGFTFAALRNAKSLAGVVFPYGFSGNLCGVDIRYADFSRTEVTENSFEYIKDLTGVIFPQSMQPLSEKFAGNHILDKTAFSQTIKETNRFGMPVRYIRTSGSLIYYRRIEEENQLPHGNILKDADLRPLDAGCKFNFRMIEKYKYFEGVIFPKYVNFYELTDLNIDFWTDKEFICCDFSHTIGFDWKAWGKAAVIRGARCPPDLDFKNADFSGIDLTDTDFSLAIPIRKNEEVIDFHADHK